MSGCKKIAAVLVLWALGIPEAVLADEHIQSRTLIHDNVTRKYLLHLPKGMNPKKPLPLVMALHGGGGNAQSMVRSTMGGLDALSDRGHFILVYPEGMGRGWNDGRHDAVALRRRRGIDDVGFISLLIDTLSQEFRINPKRVFSTGISNGGFMSFRLACELSEKITAIAPVIGGMGVEYAPQCKPTEAVAVLIIQGTEDPLVPYKGGQVRVFGQERGAILASDEVVKIWVENNKTSTRAKREKLPDQDKTDGSQGIRETYSGTSPVIRYIIEGGGHTWPGATQYLPQRIVGNLNKDMDANQVIWEFFRTQSKE